MDLDLEAIKARWRQCGCCDAGLAAPCTCPVGDPRPDMAALVAEVERLRSEVEASRFMYERCYFEIQQVLDRAHGTEEGDGAGAGIVLEVDLLLQQRDEARAEVERLRTRPAEVSS